MKIGTMGSALCLALLLAASTTLAAPAVEWTSVPDPLPDFQGASDVLPVLDGYVTVGSDLRPGDPASGGSRTCALVKTDLAGAPLWRRTYPFLLMNSCHGLAPAADGGFVLAGTANPWSSNIGAQILIIRTDAAGNQLWAKFFDANDAPDVSATGGTDVEATADGGFVVLAETGSIAPPASPTMLLKVDADGNELWRSFPGERYAEALKFNPTDDGGFILGGWRFVGVESNLPPDPADYQAWLLRVDAAGQRVWSVGFAMPGGAFGRAARQTPDGGFALVGYAGGLEDIDKYDALLLKVDAAGTKQWSVNFGGPGPDFANGLAIARDGGILVVGDQSAPYAGDFQEEKLSVTKYAADGGKRWEILMNGAPAGVSGFASADTIESTADGGAIVGGSIIAYNPGSATDGDGDLWLVKLGPEALLPPVAVAIDVKPGSDENPINLKAQGTVPVAILTTPSFDAASVDRATVRFAGAPVATKPNGNLQGSLEDVDGDGDEDLLLHFDIPELQLEVGDATATLAGATLAGAEISGTDTVKVTKTAVGKKAKKAKKKK